MDWMVHLVKDMTEFSMKSGVLPLAAIKAGIWFRRVEEETCRELQSDTQRPRQRHPPSAFLCGGGGGRGKEGKGREGQGGYGKGGGEGGRPAQITEVWAT